MKFVQISYILVLVFFTISVATPAFAEVTSFQLDNTLYTKGDQIVFSGTVDEKSKGLVSIVIRDSNGEFVLLTQAFIQPDNTFQHDLITNEKFEDHGIHNATAFIIDLKKGMTVSFDFSQDGTMPFPSITAQIKQNEPINEENNEIPQTEFKLVEKIKNPTLANFVDSSKDPQHYLDRYYNEPKYKKWFDRNYPSLTIEEAVGLTNSGIPKTIERYQNDVIADEIIPEAQAIETVENPFDEKNSDNIEIALLGLALGGLGILFAAVYGIKRKVDTNSKNISMNTISIREKMFSLLLGNKPEEVIKNRLAHGEISIKEYSRLKKALEK